MSNEILDSYTSQNVSIDINLEDTFHPNTLFLSNSHNNKFECPTYYNNDPIKGSVQITLNSYSKTNMHHSGVKIELIGEIDINLDKNEDNQNNNNNFNRFLLLTKNLSTKGILKKENNFNFEFKSKEYPYDTYIGDKFSIKYFLFVTIDIDSSTIKKEKKICIFNCDKNMQKINELFIKDNEKIKVEIGVENLLHVYFELDKRNYHLKDIITGKVSFKKINLELENMTLKIIKIEKLFGKESDMVPLGAYEIMDGPPASTEDIIYFKIFLRGIKNLSQSIKNEINNNINVSYFLCLEISDNENRNFFKKIEINLFRLPEEYYNKMKQNILEGKKMNLYDIKDIHINKENNIIENKNKDKIEDKNKDKKGNKNKYKKIKNLFGNFKNPLEEDINININENDEDKNKDEDEDKNNNINDININNDINHPKNINDKENIKQKQKKKKIYSLFNSE